MDFLHKLASNPARLGIVVCVVLAAGVVVRNALTARLHRAAQRRAARRESKN